MSSVPPPPPPPFGPQGGDNPWSTAGQPPPGYPAAPPPGYNVPGQYGQPAVAQYGQKNPFDSRGTTVLVLGILSLVICGLLGPIGWVLGNGVRRDATAAGWPEPGTSKGGRICSIISSVLLMLAAVVLVIIIIAAAASNNSGR